MSTLQISLAVLGLVLLGLVFAYNVWTYRRHAPRRAKPSKPAPTPAQPPRSEPDLLGAGSDSELPPVLHPGEPLGAAAGAADDPVLDARPLGDVAEGADSSAAVELDEFAHGNEPRGAGNAPEASEPSDSTQPKQPSVSPQPVPAPKKTAAQASAATVRPLERRVALDALIDALAVLQLEQPTAGEAILQVQPTTRRAGSKPFQVEGRNARSGQWEVVRAGQRYVQLQAGVQLANRMGPLNEIEFSEFAMKVQTFADALGAAVELPDMLREVARARELDQFASQHDAQLSFMLRSMRAAWSPGYIAQHASALGFVPSNMPGRMQLPSPQMGQAPLLILSFDAQAAQAEDLDRTAVYELYLSLDVPQVAREHQPFTHLCSAVQSLAQSMDGIVCDPDGNPLPAQALEQVGQQLEGVYASLAEHEVAAGSMLACRLFS